MTARPGAVPAGPVLLVGCGLVGTSVALALVRAGVRPHLRDLLPAHVELAESVGAGTSAEPDEVALVVVAVPPDHVAAAVVAALQEWPDAVVTDVASVKARPGRDVAHAAGPDARRYVGGHPMAGSERTGPVSASAQLFDGRTWAVTPAVDADPHAVAEVELLATACGATVVRMGAVEHDRAVARVSHLPHVVSALVAAQLVGGTAPELDLAGQGVRDVTRVAASDPVLWSQILAGNAAQVAPLLRSLRDDLDRLLVGLDDEPAAVGDLLRRANEGTARIPGKHNLAGGRDATVLVHVPDRAGELARLFADAGDCGVSIEDLRIDHDPARPVGLVEVDVRAERADELVGALTARGWQARR